MAGTKKAPRVAAKPPTELPLDDMTLTIVARFPTDDGDFIDTLQSIKEVLENIRGYGEIISTELTNVPATIDLKNYW